MIGLYKQNGGRGRLARRALSHRADKFIKGVKLCKRVWSAATRTMPYSEIVLDHFEHPRNVGELPSPDAEVRLEHPVCGDIMSLAIKLADGRIDQVRFRTRGCVASIAAGR